MVQRPCLPSINSQRKLLAGRLPRATFSLEVMAGTEEDMASQVTRVTEAEFAELDPQRVPRRLQCARYHD